MRRAALVRGLEEESAGWRGGWFAGGAIWEGSAEGPCVREDRDAGGGAGFERLPGVCEWANGDLFDHGRESSAGDE